MHRLPSNLQQVVLNQKSNNFQEVVHATLMVEAVRSTLGGGVQKKMLAFPTIDIRPHLLGIPQTSSVEVWAQIFHVGYVVKEMGTVCRTVQSSQWLRLF